MTWYVIRAVSVSMLMSLVITMIVCLAFVLALFSTVLMSAVFVSMIDNTSAKLKNFE